MADFIYQQGSTPNTRVALSQKNRIYSTKYGADKASQVGVLSTFSYDESRNVEAVRGVGFGDRVAELVPGVTEPMNIKLNRTMLYTANIIQELGYAGGVDGIVRSLRHHRWPFDLQSELVFSEVVTGKYAGDQGPGAAPNGIGGAQAIITRFIACWLESYSVDYSTDNVMVVEDCGGKATDVVDGASQWGLDVNTYGPNMLAGNAAKSVLFQK